MCAFLIVSLPFQAYWGWTGTESDSLSIREPVACTINIVTVVNYAARGIIYDCSGVAIKKLRVRFTLLGSNLS